MLERGAARFAHVDHMDDDTTASSIHPIPDD
jgi:hypothetical protein